VILAFETGRQLGTRAIFAEEVKGTDGSARREFRRGFRIEPGERVLLVDDILTTGGSLIAMLPAVEAMGGEIIECAVLVDRSGGMASLTSPATGRVYPLRALWAMDLPTYEPGPSSCPRCADETPLHAPGSTGTGVS
jgi:orotate phosphoribosyltransferase